MVGKFKIFLIMIFFLLINFAILVPGGIAITEGNLEENTVDDQVNVNLTVEKYAAIEYDRDPMEDGLDFLEAEGSTGIYNTNGNSNWENYLQNDIWDEKDWETHPVQDRNGMRQAIVEMFIASNTNIEIQFEFIEGDEWIKSDTVFALWNANGDMSEAYDDTTFGKHEDYNVETSFTQTSNIKREYHLVGGFLIEDITQQEAGDYTAEIQLTVSSVD